MSGGSFDYLYRAEGLSGLLAQRHHLKDMADTLARLGYAADAATETHALLANIDAADVHADAALARLARIWKAVEWWKSYDSDEDDVREALAVYRGETPPERKNYRLTPDEAAAVEAMRTPAPTTGGPTRLVLVLGANTLDADAATDTLAANSQKVIIATPETGIPHGMPLPDVVVTTTEYQDIDVAIRERLEHELRRTRAKRRRQ